MGLRGITEQQAFEIIRRHSQNRNIKVRDLAQRIVTGTYSHLEPEQGQG